MGSCRKSPRFPASCLFASSSNDYFSISDNDDSPARAFNVFCKKVNVFGLEVFATAGVSDRNYCIVPMFLLSTLTMMKMEQ